MERLTHDADIGLEDWEETLFFVKSDPSGAYNILDIARFQGEAEFDEILKNIALRLAAYEDTGLTPEEVQQMRWIPVEERPPEEIGNYLVVVCDEHLPRDERIWNGTIMGEGFYGEEDWDMEYSGYIHDVTGMVTHWMPFPNFPEEEPNGKK